MTNEQRQARAIQKASEQRAHVLAIPGRPGFFQVKSATDAAERYTVAVSGGRAECSCKAATYGNPCWHGVKVEGRLIRESVRPQLASPTRVPLSWREFPRDEFDEEEAYAQRAEMRRDDWEWEAD